MKKVLLLFTLLLAIVAGMVLAQNYLKTNSFFPLGKNPTISINKQIFELIVADSPEKKEIGLSKTENLSENKGMVFLFDNPDYYPFWMKDMKISIDIIYIKNDEIVTILENVQPPKNSQESPIVYTPTEPADKVLEINAGLSKKYNFKKGDKITLENI